MGETFRAKRQDRARSEPDHVSLSTNTLGNSVALWLQGLASYEVPSKEISTKEFSAEISSTHTGKFSSRTSISSLFLQFPVRTQITFKLCGAKA